MPKLSATFAGQYQTQVAPGYDGYVNVKLDISGSARLSNDNSPQAMTSDYRVVNTRMGVLHGLDPYLHGPVAANTDGIYKYVGDDWRKVATAAPFRSMRAATIITRL